MISPDFVLDQNSSVSNLIKPSDDICYFSVSKQNGKNVVYDLYKYTDKSGEPTLIAENKNSVYIYGDASNICGYLGEGYHIILVKHYDSYYLLEINLTTLRSSGESGNVVVYKDDTIVYESSFDLRTTTMLYQIYENGVFILLRDVLMIKNKEIVSTNLPQLLSTIIRYKNNVLYLFEYSGSPKFEYEWYVDDKLVLKSSNLTYYDGYIIVDKQMYIL